MVLGELLFTERGVLSLNGLNHSQDRPCAVCPLIIHEFIYLLSELHQGYALHQTGVSTQLPDQALIISLATPSSYSE